MLHNFFDLNVGYIELREKSFEILVEPLSIFKIAIVFGYVYCQKFIVASLKTLKLWSNYRY